ncbi:hypothetical protein C8Q80DRAFT_16990 [Daedaleopsis nitida]|nr:hypothetical protein C8Q80DRAFT_16990 [Daedaleopsis nitida]
MVSVRDPPLHLGLGHGRVYVRMTRPPCAHSVHSTPRTRRAGVLSLCAPSQDMYSPAGDDNPRWELGRRRFGWNRKTFAPRRGRTTRNVLSLPATAQTVHAGTSIQSPQVSTPQRPLPIPSRPWAFWQWHAPPGVPVAAPCQCQRRLISSGKDRNGLGARSLVTSPLVHHRLREAVRSAPLTVTTSYVHVRHRQPANSPGILVGCVCWFSCSAGRSVRSFPPIAPGTQS